MGATVSAYWQGMTEEDHRGLPGFSNDCLAWANWMVELTNHPRAVRAMELHAVSELLTIKTDGVPNNEVHWVTPDGLGFAALRLRALIQVGSPGLDAILKSYAVGANNDDPAAEELARDLWDISEIALTCKKRGVKKMTLEVNW
ncbi:MAG: hypothetical protein U0795_12460 [Pirellulales bacterium]